MLAHDTTVMILAAGRGERLRPLTDHTPKPLLKVGDRSLIEHHLYRLKAFGFRHIVINLAHLGEQIATRLGNGQRYQLNIDYSDESQTGALETAGGIRHALGLIKSEYFIAINADIWTDFDYRKLLAQKPGYSTLVMVTNPQHNHGGDFLVESDGFIKTRQPSTEPSLNSFTFSGIARYPKSVFIDLPEKKMALMPVFINMIAKQSLLALIHHGIWHDIGTAQRLAQLRSKYAD